MNRNQDILTAYEMNRRSLVRIAMSITGNMDDAEDAVQAVIARTLEHTPNVRDALQFLKVAVRNEAISQWRKMSARQKIEQSLPLDEEDIPYDFDNLATSVEAFVEQNLSASVRKVVRSVFYNGNSYHETSLQLGVSVSTVNKHVVTALQRLRKHFKDTAS